MELQTAYTAIYFEINLVSLILLALIWYKTAGISKMVAQRNFSMAICTEMVFILSDTFCAAIWRGSLRLSAAALLAGKEVYFFSTALMCFFWFLYFEHLQNSPLGKDRVKVLFSSALVWLIAAALLVNVSTGILFFVDGAGVYHRGPLFLLQYLVAYVYVFFSCGRALLGVFRKDRAAERRKLISLALFPIAPAIAGVLQFRYPELPIACAALALATLAMYLNWTEEMISVDPLTHLKNRKQLLYSFEQWSRGGEGDAAFYLMIVDANKFKAINDTYGHVEGDAALVRIADALRAACKEYPRRTNIARYGGDEFVVLAQANGIEPIQALRRRIGELLGELNRAAGAPYELSVSIGVTRSEGNRSLRELIAEADRQLYKEKNERHARA